MHEFMTQCIHEVPLGMEGGLVTLAVLLMPRLEMNSIIPVPP